MAAGVVEDAVVLGADLFELLLELVEQALAPVVCAGDERDAGVAVADDEIGEDGRDRGVGRHGAEVVGGVGLGGERRRGIRRGTLRNLLVEQGLDEGLGDAGGAGADDGVHAAR